MKQCLWTISPILGPKLVVMATSIDRSRDEYQIEHLRPQCRVFKPENLVMVGQGGYEISLLQLKEEIKRKKISAVECE